MSRVKEQKARCLCMCKSSGLWRGKLGDKAVNTLLKNIQIQYLTSKHKIDKRHEQVFHRREHTDGKYMKTYSSSLAIREMH